MKALGYIGAFLGGAIAGAALGVLIAPENGASTRQKIASTMSDFCKKHNLKLSHEEMNDIVEEVEGAAQGTEI